MAKVGHIEKFKVEYSNAEVAEVKQWFKDHIDRLPKTLQIDDCLYSEDLHKTAESYLQLLSNIPQSIVFNGYVAQLLMIREAIFRDYPDFE